MKSILITLICLTLLIFCNSCSDDKSNLLGSQSIKGSGNLVSENRNVIEFEELTFSAAGDVNITDGSPQSIKITVDDNILPILETISFNKLLILKIENGYSASDYELTVDIVVENLKALSLNGAGTITGMNLIQTDQFNIQHSGVGDINLNLQSSSLTSDFSGVGKIELNGNANLHQCFASAVGSINSFGFETYKSDLTVQGSTNVEAFVTDTLTASISGFGTVYYKGNPNLKVNTTGMGRLINAN